jgi:hypothetical protein
MVHKFARGAAAVFIAAVICSPAVADTPPSANAPAARKSGTDPNEVICQRQEVVGSRLQKRRVCMTRAQWADLRLQDRQALDKAQTMQGMKGE